jgi:hypothetical protein
VISQREDAHVSAGLKLLVEQFRGKPVIEALLSSYLSRVQELEDELWIVLWGWVLGNATARQLDDLGAIVGELREGRDDTEYEAAIRVRIRINRSKGRTIDVIDVAALLLEVFSFIEPGMLDWQVDAYEVSTSRAISIIKALTQTKAASSYGNLVTADWSTSEVMRLSSAAGGTVYMMGSAHGATLENRKLPAALPTNPPYRRS